MSSDSIAFSPFQFIVLFRSILDYYKVRQSQNYDFVNEKRQKMFALMKEVGSMGKLQIAASSYIAKIDKTGYLQRFVDFWHRSICNVPAQKPVRLFLKKAQSLDRQEVDHIFDSISTQLMAYNKILEFCNETHQESVAACKKILAKYYINIFDYKDNQPQFIFYSKADLLKRCRVRGFYPKQRAKNELLKGLLQHLISR